MTGTPSILVVDDEIRMCESVRILLGERNYRIETCPKRFTIQRSGLDIEHRALDFNDHVHVDAVILVAPCGGDAVLVTQGGDDDGAGHQRDLDLIDAKRETQATGHALDLRAFGAVLHQQQGGSGAQARDVALLVFGPPSA